MNSPLGEAVSPPPPTSPSTSPAAGAAGFVGPLIHANEVRHRRALAGRGLLGTRRVAKQTVTLQESLPTLAGLPCSSGPAVSQETHRGDLEKRAALLRAQALSIDPEELRNSLSQAARPVSCPAG